MFATNIFLLKSKNFMIRTGPIVGIYVREFRYFNFFGLKIILDKMTVIFLLQLLKLRKETIQWMKARLIEGVRRKALDRVMKNLLSFDLLKANHFSGMALQDRHIPMEFFHE